MRTREGDVLRTRPGAVTGSVWLSALCAAFTPTSIGYQDLAGFFAGLTLMRQRPGTASGFIFISGEDETGISNAIIHPKVYERNQMAVTGGKFLMIEGLLQNQDSVVSVKASAVRVLELGPIDMRSHDFH